MRSAGFIAASLVLSACGAKTPPPAPGPAAPVAVEDAGALLVDAVAIVDAGAPAAATTAAVTEETDKEEWKPPQCKMPKSGCAALKPKSGSIQMERTACNGPCPIYTVTIKTDGTVTWHGDMFVDAQEDKTYQAEPGDVAELFALVGRSCFSSFRGQYKSGRTDHPWANLTLKVDGRTKLVKHNVVSAGDDDDTKRKCDDEDKLLSIEKKIDVVAKTRKLVGNHGR